VREIASPTVTATEIEAVNGIEIEIEIETGIGIATAIGTATLTPGVAGVTATIVVVKNVGAESVNAAASSIRRASTCLQITADTVKA
jgi:hypothetical protein